MRHDENTQLEHAGQDSFLDVTTNIVGILIILVMVVGMRAQNPIVQASTVPVPTAEELESIGKNAAAIEYDVRRLGQEIASVDSTSEAKSAARESLATMIAAAEKEIGDRRAKLGSSKQEDFDLRRQLDESKAVLDRGEQELESLESQKTPTVEVHHYPTPISRTVLGHEVHFQINHGRVSYVPMDEFANDIRAEIRGSNLAQLGEKSGVVGPRRGFECHYALQVILDRREGVVRVTGDFQFIPVGIEQGETLDIALRNQSEFRAMLSSHSPRDTTVTLWTYPDSFDMYRQVKEELHQLGYAIAARPMPEGTFIGGSDRGSRSSAQ